MMAWRQKTWYTTAKALNYSVPTLLLFLLQCHLIKWILKSQGHQYMEDKSQEKSSHVLLSHHRALEPLGKHSGIDVCSHCSVCSLFLRGFWSITLRSSVLAYLIISKHERERNTKMSEKKASMSNQQPIYLKINLKVYPLSPAASLNALDNTLLSSLKAKRED